jgi:PTH1 family peptidyl-tRNA hydrolase
MKLIVGLGNPGLEYEKTRHNLGFFIIDCLAKTMEIRGEFRDKFLGNYFQCADFILLKPQNYMNNSGDCVLSFVNFFKIPVDQILIIYDEVYFPLGSFRYKINGSCGGHNGIKGIISSLKNSKFKRLRVGVGYDKTKNLANWVLEKFTEEELAILSKTKEELLGGIIEWIKGLEFNKLMNKWNRRKKI